MQTKQYGDPMWPNFALSGGWNLTVYLLPSILSTPRVGPYHLVMGEFYYFIKNNQLLMITIP